MRINQYLAFNTGMSRRAADEAIKSGRVTINGQPAALGVSVLPTDTVCLDAAAVNKIGQFTTILLNKPVGYVCSRQGQGSQTIYELLPEELNTLKPVGRLDKDSSGLLILTNNGNLANELTHPKFQKQKVYEVILNTPLSTTHQNSIEKGILLEDGISSLKLTGSDIAWTVTMSEGRNRQIRRTFEALGYQVIKLHRTQLGNFKLLDLGPAQHKII